MKEHHWLLLIGAGLVLYLVWKRSQSNQMLVAGVSQSPGGAPSVVIQPSPPVSTINPANISDTIVSGTDPQADADALAYYQQNGVWPDWYTIDPNNPPQGVLIDLSSLV